MSDNFNLANNAWRFYSSREDVFQPSPEKVKNTTTNSLWSVYDFLILLWNDFTRQGEPSRNYRR